MIRSLPIMATIAAVPALASSASSDEAGLPPLLPDPLVVESIDGVLDLRLEAAPAEITVAGQTFRSNVYNGEYLPPVIKVRRGDQVKIELVNNIGPADIQIDAPQETNLHYHGMNISPREPADNVYITIPSGQPGANPNPPQVATSQYRDGNVYHYSYTIPANHPRGLNWYHSHAHHYGEQQVLSGMSGLLIVDGFLPQQFPELAKLTEKSLLLKDIELPGAADGAPKTKTINGMIGGRIDMQPGEWQVWNIANIGADAFFEFAVDGHKMWVIARDSNVLAEPDEDTSVLLPPASRAIVAIRAEEAGDYAIRTLNVDTGPQGDPNPQEALAILHVAGEQSTADDTAIRNRMIIGAAAPEELDWSALRLGKVPVTRKREIVFSETADGNTFFINGKKHSWDRMDTTVRLGDVEEWTVKNVSGERHVFHIHQLDFLVTTINNDDQDATGLRDTIDVPPMVNGVPGEVKLIIPFTDPNIVGRFVYHCHILEHGDNGMMANIQVLPASE